MFRRFLNDKSGNFGAALAITGMALVGVVGGSIDLSWRERMETRLQDVVDAATLAGASAAMQGKSKPEQDEEIRRYFNQNCTLADCSTAMNLTIDIQDSHIHVESKGGVKPFFMAMMGVEELGIDAVARVNLGRNHVEVHLALDNSGSMNIVDGEPAMARMLGVFQPYTESMGYTVGCAFACHQATDGSGRTVSFGGLTGAQIARANNIPLREDRVKSVMATETRRILSDDTRETAKVAVHAFDWNSRKILAPTNNIARAEAAIASIQNESIGSQYHNMSYELAKAVGPSGDGSSASSPRKIIVMITDGIQQHYTTYVPQIIEQSSCDRLKAEGRELYVLNLAYPDPDLIATIPDGDAINAVRDFYDDIEPALISCASPGRYFRAGYGDTIDTALKAVVDEIKRNNKVYLAM